MPKKTKPVTTKFREPYYKLADSIQAFKTVSRGDVALKKLIDEMQLRLERIRKNLNENYDWD